MTAKQLSVGQDAAQGMDKREYDENGWFLVENNPLSKTGVYPYKGKNFGLPNVDPERFYNVYRSPEELGNPETVDSFKLIPWINEHKMLGSEEEGFTPPEQKGIEGIVGEKVWFSAADGILYGNIKVISESMKNEIYSGKSELSLGYTCKYVYEPGIAPDGTPYEYKQVNIRGNHLALVVAGRMGHEVAVMDESETNGGSMAKEGEEGKANEEGKGKDAGEGGAAQPSQGMNLAEAEKMFKEVLPVLRRMEQMFAAKDAAPAAAEKPAAKDENPDVMPDNPDATDDDEKISAGMDASEIANVIEKRLAAKRDLYERVSAVVGAFDHSEMTVPKIAEYAVKKMELSVPKGVRPFDYLNGYLAAKGSAKTAVATAMDGAEKPKTKFAALVGKFAK